MGKKGIVLIAIVFLIIFIGIAIFGVTTFIVQRFQSYGSEQTIERCRSNAKAGVAYAIYQFRANATNFSGTVTIDSTNSATVTTTGSGSTAVSNLVTDATGANNSASNKNIAGVTLTNTSASSTITIATMQITWTGTRKLSSISIGGSTVWSVGGGTSGSTFDITDFTLSTSGPPNPYALQLNFSGNMNGTTITIIYTMTDASNNGPSGCTVFPAQGSTCQASGGSLTITSIGKTADPKYSKTVVATYNTSTGKVTAYTATN